ncbi:MAG: DUF6790 family protein [Methylococcus sp.]
MYLYFILATLWILPLLAIGVEYRRKPAPLLELVGKWFLFLGVGVRLSVTGLSQILNPGFTAAILHLETGAYVIIQELGFTNLLLGGIALVSLFQPGYRILATGGAGFMGFAGLLHLSRLSPETTRNEIIALISDLWIFTVAMVYLGYRIVSMIQATTARMTGG